MTSVLLRRVWTVSSAALRADSVRLLAVLPVRAAGFSTAAAVPASASAQKEVKVEADADLVAMLVASAHWKNEGGFLSKAYEFKDDKTAGLFVARCECQPGWRGACTGRPEILRPVPPFPPSRLRAPPPPPPAPPQPRTCGQSCAAPHRT